MSDAFGKQLLLRKAKKKAPKKKRKLSATDISSSTSVIHPIPIQKPKTDNEPQIHPRDLRRAIALRRRRPAVVAAAVSPKVTQSVPEVKSLQEICAKRLSEHMEHFQHQVFRLDSKTFAAILRMAGSRITEPVLSSLSIANPHVSSDETKL